MRKISEFKNEDAIDLLADLIEPASEIFADKEVVKGITGDGNKMQIAKLVLKKHKKAILEILARVNGVPVKNYTCNPVTILVDVMALINDEELLSFFTEQGAKITE